MIGSIEESETHTISFDDQTIYFYTVGNKSDPPLVFLHGILAFTEAYSDFIENLSKKYFVIGIDLRGHGRSSVGQRPFSFKDITKDIVKVTNALDIEKFYVVGHSAGGFIALSLIKYFPEKVIKGASIASLYNHAGIDYADTGHDYLTEQGFQANNNLRNNYTLKIADLAYEKMGEKEKFDQTKKIMMDYGNIMYPSFSDSILQEILTPILVFVAQKDKRIKPEHTTKMAELLPNSKLIIVEGARHFGITKKKRYVKILSDEIFEFFSKYEE